MATTVCIIFFALLLLHPLSSTIAILLVSCHPPPLLPLSSSFLHRVHVIFLLSSPLTLSSLSSIFLFHHPPIDSSLTSSPILSYHTLIFRFSSFSHHSFLLPPSSHANRPSWPNTTRAMIYKPCTSSMVPSGTRHIPSYSTTW